MILGVGTDIIEISRIEKVFVKYGTKFIKKILAAGELIEFANISKNKRKYFLAKRFAAKEAIVKAMNIGFTNGIWFTDIMISHSVNGQPIAIIDKAILHNLNVEHQTVHLTISDEKSYAVAFAVIEQ